MKFMEDQTAYYKQATKGENSNLGKGCKSVLSAGTGQLHSHRDTLKYAY